MAIEICILLSPDNWLYFIIHWGYELLQKKITYVKNFLMSWTCLKKREKAKGDTGKMGWVLAQNS